MVQLAECLNLHFGTQPHVGIRAQRGACLKLPLSLLLPLSPAHAQSLSKMKKQIFLCALSAIYGIILDTVQIHVNVLIHSSNFIFALNYYIFNLKMGKQKVTGKPNCL